MNETPSRVIYLIPPNDPEGRVLFREYHEIPHIPLGFIRFEETPEEKKKRLKKERKEKTRQFKQELRHRMKNKQYHK